MEYTLSCPSCGGKVRVPASLLGKNVRCPRCQHTYRAEAPADAVDDVEVLDEPRRRRRPRDEDYEEDYDDRPQRLSRADIRAKVQGPAIGIMVTGWISVALVVLNLAVTAYAVYQISTMRGAGVRVNWPLVAGRVIGSLIGLAIAILVIRAGSNMRSLRDRRSAMTASILCMLPCTFCITGLPFGIWSLVVLNNPDVQRAFRE